MASAELPLARTVDELFALLRSTHAELEQIVARLDVAHLTGVEDRDGWTVKDHLAHVVAWEQHMLGRLAGQSPPAAAGVGDDTYAAFTADGTEDPTDALNEMIFQRWQYVPLDEVLDSFRSSFQEVLAAASALSDDELAAPIDKGGDVSRIQQIAEDGYRHYADHAAWIRRFV